MRLSDLSQEGALLAVKTMIGVCVGSGTREPARPGGEQRPLTARGFPATAADGPAGRARGAYTTCRLHLYRESSLISEPDDLFKCYIMFNWS